MTDLTEKLTQSPAGLILQAITITLLGAGGWVGKDAYEEIRSEMIQQRVSTAEMRKTIEAWSTRSAISEASIDRLNVRLANIEHRMTKIEVLVDMTSGASSRSE